MTRDGVMLLRVLCEPRQALTLDAGQWNGLLECAARHALLARVGILLEDAGCLSEVPQTARDLIEDALAEAQANHTSQRFEANRVLHALRGIEVPVLLLKGGAYLLAGLPPSRGRLSGDLDILVPRDRIGDVEQAMVKEGWETLITDAYDIRYYREWSHQIPPLRHAGRRSELDIHHAIAPPTGRAGPDTGAILRESQALPDTALRVLCPADMVLHSAVHLFNEQMTKTLRELIDMHDLMTYFDRDDEFWRRLMAHAKTHNLQRPLYYCTRYCRRFLNTRIPDRAAKDIGTLAPNALALAAMDYLVEASLVHERPDRAAPKAAFASWLLFVRSHWLRMPPGMLIRHILFKTWRRTGHGLESGPPPP